MIRLILGVIGGYAFFALTALLVFTISGRDPHAPADMFFMVGMIGAGAIAALAGGYFGAAIARGYERPAGIAIALIIAGAAAASLIAQPAQDARWSQLSALVFMSPMALLGAFVRARRMRR